MATAIVNALKVGNPELTGPAEAAALTQWTTICGSVIPHLVTNSLVSATVAAGIPVATAGSPSAQTGATTAPGAATGTIS